MVAAAAGLPPHPARRLGGLAVAIPEDADRLWQRLRLTNAEHARLSAMGADWRAFSPARDEAAARALLYALKPESYVDCALLAWARSRASAHDAAWRELAGLPQRWDAPSFPIRAADLIARGVKPGPALGAALRAAESAWIAADFPIENERLQEILNAAVPPH
jgi:poly(A) polymerase